MTIIEMHQKCDLLLDKANSPWYTSAEKDSFINEAQNEFVETRYKLFEENERIRKALLPLVRNSVGANTSIINYDVITEFMFTLSLSGMFNKVCGTGTKLQRVHPLQLDDEIGVESDPFNKSADDNPNYIEYNDGVNNIAQIKSDTTPLSYTLKYLKRARSVFNDTNNPLNNIDSEMPIFVHDEIVSIAVREMLANTEQIQGYQLQQNEIQNEN